MFKKFSLCFFIVILKSTGSDKFVALGTPVSPEGVGLTGSGQWCATYYLHLGIPSGAIFLVIPEDVPAGFAAIYGFAPPITKGNDHRFGFGFRLGNHADFQILYEFGPQSVTKPLHPPKVRSTSYRQRFVRRRPVFELLVRAGVIKRNSYDFKDIQDCDDEPR